MHHQHNITNTKIGNEAKQKSHRSFEAPISCPVQARPPHRHIHRAWLAFPNEYPFDNHTCPYGYDTEPKYQNIDQLSQCIDKTTFTLILLTYQYTNASNYILFVYQLNYVFMHCLLLQSKYQYISLPLQQYITAFDVSAQSII